MITSAKIRLRNKKMSDARHDYTWQTDPELAQLDAAPRLTMSYAQYLLDYTWELHLSSRQTQRFAVETASGRHIGNCSYYHIDEKKGEAEVGIMIGDRAYWDNGYGTETICMLIDHIFGKTHLKRLYLKTLSSNIRAQRCFLKCGFKPCGQMTRDGYDFVLMEIHRGQWRPPSAREGRGMENITSEKQ